MPTDSATLTLSNSYTPQSTFNVKWPIHKLTINVAVGKCILQVRDQENADFYMSPLKEITLGVGYNSIPFPVIYGFRLKNAVATGLNSIVTVTWTGPG